MAHRCFRATNCPQTGQDRTRLSRFSLTEWYEGTSVSPLGDATPADPIPEPPADSRPVDLGTSGALPSRSYRDPVRLAPPSPIAARSARCQIARRLFLSHSARARRRSARGGPPPSADTLLKGERMENGEGMVHHWSECPR